MFKQRLLVSATIALTSISLAYGQGRSGRDRGAGGPNGAAAEAQQRIQARVNQRVGQQAQRRIADGVSRAAQRSSVAAEKAAQAAAQSAARRSARDAASGKTNIRAFANSRGVRPETVAAKAAAHADVHAVISAGLATGEPLHFTEQQRGLVNEVFGDAGLLEPGTANRSEGNSPQTGFAGKNRKDNRDTSPPAPGTRANVRARLANAIRVRRAQISQLRDQAIDSGNPKLLERADHFEKTLEIFLANQARVEANLAEATVRSRGSIATSPDENSSLNPDATPRTADASTESGLFGESTVELETRVE